jgi:hypothetical protein
VASSTTALLMSLLMCAVAAAYLFRTPLRQLRWARGQRCLCCGYPSIPGGERCPECGQAPAAAFRQRRRMRIQICGGLLLFTGGLCSAVLFILPIERRLALVPNSAIVRLSSFDCGTGLQLELLYEAGRRHYTPRDFDKLAVRLSWLVRHSNSLVLADKASYLLRISCDDGQGGFYCEGDPYRRSSALNALSEGDTLDRVMADLLGLLQDPDIGRDDLACRVIIRCPAERIGVEEALEQLLARMRPGAATSLRAHWGIENR